MSSDISEKRVLAMELLDLARKIQPQSARIEGIKDRLKEISEKSGSFREVVLDKGVVTVTAATRPKFRGVLPTFDAELYLALDEDERKKLEQDGVVTVTPSYGRPGHASVKVALAEP